MRILVIIGECVQVNSSSNLCNLAILRGLIELGNDVTLLSADGKGYSVDPSMEIPEGVHCFTYRSMTLYEKLSKIKKGMYTSTLNEDRQIRSSGPVRRRTPKAKKIILSLYGAHGVYSKFAKKAYVYRSKEKFDLVISLSNPPSSHLLAYKLIKSGHVKCSHWVQVWEDPWYKDISGYTHNESVLCEERKLLSLAERVCYVSPITLENQKELFPESADKMFWKPLPSYYKLDDSKEPLLNEDRTFGYFGDYKSHVRNLKEFYLAAKTMDVVANICGDSNLRLESTEKIHVFPRLDLADLRQIEDRTGVLVFLCNRRGGQIPGKIYQYAATDKTILFILDGTEEEKQILKEYFEPFNRFVFCENNQEDIERAIQSIQKGEIGNVVNKPLTQFSPASIVSQILEESMREIQ